MSGGQRSATGRPLFAARNVVVALLACAAAPLLLQRAQLPLGIPLGVVALIAVLALLRYREVISADHRRLVFPALILQLVALCAVRLAGWWPCDVACQGGGHYQHLGGVQVTWLALLAYAILALLAIRDARRRAWCPWLVRGTLLLASGSLFFLWVSAALGLDCPFCLAVHGTMLFAVLCLQPLPAGMRWWDVVAWVVAGFLILNLAFHHRIVADVATSAGGADGGIDAFMGTHPPPADPAAVAALRASVAYRAIDAGRRRGDAAARYQVELVLDPHCQACAEQHGALLDVLRPLTSGPTPRLGLVTRLLARASDPSGADLDRHLLASAGLGAQRFHTVLAVVLGAPAERGFASLASRVAEVDDPAAIAEALARDRAAVEQLMADDAARLRLLDADRTTPQVLVVDSASGAVRGRWSGSIDAAAMARELDALLAR